MVVKLQPNPHCRDSLLKPGLHIQPNRRESAIQLIHDGMDSRCPIQDKLVACVAAPVSTKSNPRLVVDRVFRRSTSGLDSYEVRTSRSPSSLECRLPSIHLLRCWRYNRAPYAQLMLTKTRWVKCIQCTNSNEPNHRRVSPQTVTKLDPQL